MEERTGSGEMSVEEGAGGGPLPGRSQEEGACVDTGSHHTEAKMPPAQVPSRPTHLNYLLTQLNCVLTRSFMLIGLPLNLFLLSRQPQLI